MEMILNKKGIQINDVRPTEHHESGQAGYDSGLTIIGGVQAETSFKNALIKP